VGVGEKVELRDVIVKYKAQDKPEAATTFVLHLEDQIGTLENFAGRCQLISENELLGTAYRHLVSGNYRTIFRIFGARVIILRVLHGTRLLDIGLLKGPAK
jgi:plasmid stabilization system protein ParE